MANNGGGGGGGGNNRRGKGKGRSDGGGAGGGANKVSSGPDDGVTGNSIALLKNVHKNVLQDIFAYPIEDPSKRFEGLPDHPTVQYIYTFSMPIDILEPTATSFGSVMRVEREYRHYQDLLLMLSMALTDPEVGTPLNVNVDGDDNAPAGGGGPAAPANPVGAPGGGNQPGRKQQHAPGNRGPRELVKNDRDMRGHVEEHSELMFTYKNMRFPRVVVYRETIYNTHNKPTFYTFWIFVYDKNYNIGEALERVITQNNEVYESGNYNVGPDSYVSHSNIINTTRFIEGVVYPYIRDGINNYMHPSVRQEYQMVAASLNDKNAMNGVAVPLHNREHPAHPSHTLDVVSRFTMLPDVCEDQRDPGRYFNMRNANNIDEFGVGAHHPHAGVLPTIREEGEDDALNALTDAAVNDDIDSELNDIISVTKDRAGVYVNGSVNRFNDNEYVDGAAHSAGPIQNGGHIALNKNTINHLREVPASNFEGFPVPARVCCIESFYMGRRLMNIPLPNFVYDEVNGTRNDTMTSDAGTRYHIEISKNDTLERIQGMTTEQRRKEVDDILDSFDANYRIPVNDAVLNPDETYLKTLQTLREIQLDIYEERSYNTARAEVVGWLNSTTESTYQGSGDDPLTRGYMFGGILPENTQGISVPELRHYMTQVPFLKLRLTNSLEKRRFEFMNQVDKDPEGYQNGYLGLCKRQARIAYNILMESPDIPESNRIARNWFKRLPPSEQWGEHPHILTNVSSYANMKVKLLSRYSHIFRGSVNHSTYMLSDLVYKGSFLYDWGLRLHLLQLGGPQIGKSHVYESLEVEAMPGSFEVLGHVTDKQGTGNEIHVDKVVCMHEAPLALVGVDRFGRETIADPITKDRLTRCRTISRRATTDKDGNVITVEYLAMHMTNSLYATNEVIPPEDSPLMTRFIPLVVNNVKRPDFNAADANMPLKDIITGDENMIQIHHSQLFNWYVFLTMKMIMAAVIPPVSTDASDVLVKEILAKFTDITGTPTNQTRKRKMVTDMMLVKTVEKAVSNALFSASSLQFSQRFNEETGKIEVVPFDVDLIVDEVMPRLYVDDEIVVDVLTLCAFMWEYEHRYSILDTIMKRFGKHGESPLKSPLFIRENGPQFRRIPNPNFDMAAAHQLHSASSGPRQGTGPVQRDFSDRGQTRSNFSALSRSRIQGGVQITGSAVHGEGMNDGGHGDEDDGDFINIYDQFIDDPRYVRIVGQNMADINTMITSRMQEDKLPSENEVQRTLRDASRVAFKAHPVTLELVEHITPVQVHGSMEAVEKARLEAASSELMTDDVPSEVDDPMLRNAIAVARGGSVTHVNVVQRIQQQTLQGYERVKALRRRKAQMRWVLHKDQPETVERAVIIERNPEKPSEIQVSVLVEYLAEDHHKDAMLKAITEIMSNKTVPEEGRTFITSLPYIYKGASNDYIRSGEIMPQFLRTIHIKRRDDANMGTTFTTIGTLDSMAFTKSTMRSQHDGAKANDFGIGAFINSKMGLEFTESMPLNDYAGWRHLLRCGYLPSTTAYHKFTPDMDTEVNLKITQNMIKDTTSNLIIIPNYPQTSVAEYIKTRCLNSRIRTISSPEMRARLLNSSDSIISHALGVATPTQIDALKNKKKARKVAMREVIGRINEKSNYVTPTMEIDRTPRAAVNQKNSLVSSVIHDLDIHLDDVFSDANTASPTRSLTLEKGPPPSKKRRIDAPPNVMALPPPSLPTLTLNNSKKRKMSDMLANAMLPPPPNKSARHHDDQTMDQRLRTHADPYATV